MDQYLSFLGICYALGAFLHFLDLLDLRLQFSSMSLTWQSWIVFLLVADLATSICLIKNKELARYLFIFVATMQLIVYLAFSDIFGSQYLLIIFHAITLIIFFVVQICSKPTAN